MHPKEHLPHLDGWRGLAILLVLICHFADIGFLSIGVTVFFVLSGMLMSNILFIKRTPLKTFYIRRASRIFPALAVYLICIAGVDYALNDLANRSELVSAALFVRSYWVDVPLRQQVPVAHTWSLAAEEHGYIALSLLALWSATRQTTRLRIVLWVCCCIPLAAFLAYKGLAPNAASGQFFLRTEVALFPLLFSAALFYELRQQGVTDAPSWLSPATLLLALLIAAFSSSVFIKYLLCSLLLAVSINTINSSAPKFLALMRLPPLRWLGVCSYSIYLWQQLFYWLPTALPHFTANKPALLLLALITGALSYYWIEAPLRSYLNRRWGNHENGQNH